MILVNRSQRDLLAGVHITSTDALLAMTAIHPSDFDYPLAPGCTT